MTRFAALLFLLMAIQAESADWPHWRGPGRNDVSQEASGWDGKTWLKGELWKVAAGEGSSSPIVAGNQVFLTGWSGNRDTVFCLDADSGMEQWKQSYASPRYGRFAVGDQSLYSGACSTPEYDPATHVLFTLGVDGDLNAWDTRQKGRRLWSLNIYDRYKAERRPEVAKRRKTRRDYGYMSSPLVYQNQLIVEVGAKSGNLVAFDKRTGKEQWRSENHDEAGHTGGPVPMTVEGIPCVATLTLRNLVVTQIAGSSAGKTIATYPWTTDFANNISTPAVSGDSVIVTSAYNHVAMCRVKVTLKGATKVWENELASGVCSPIIHEGKVYWAWRGVHCVDFATGKELWSGGKVGSQGSCILTADHRLIVYANKGDLSLVETAARSPRKYTQVDAGSVLSRTDAWPHVVLANGRLICRDRSGNVRCVAVSKELAAKTASNPAPSVPAGPTTSPGSTTSVKPARPVALKGDWPGTTSQLEVGWDRGFKNGQILDGAPVLVGSQLPLPIQFKPRESARFSKNGTMRFDGGAFVLPDFGPRLAASARRNNQLSIEVVLTSNRPKQTGPARIVSFSSDGYSRNFTIGQEGDELILRLRTTRTGTNGMKPETKLGPLPASKRTHLVVSYRPGQLDCWINGQKVVSTDRVQGDFSNWDPKHHLLIGDEWDGGKTRKWRGQIDRLAIYTRAMTDSEVQQRYRMAGSPAK
jgi:outer membrane protein assembly factor BamB